MQPTKNIKEKGMSVTQASRARKLEIELLMMRSSPPIARRMTVDSRTPVGPTASVMHLLMLQMPPQWCVSKRS